MRCLDEGVDIPDARIAYLLASSTNPRQFIQRRVVSSAVRRGRRTPTSLTSLRCRLPPAVGRYQPSKISCWSANGESQGVRRPCTKQAQAMQSLLEIRRRHNLLDIWERN